MREDKQLSLEEALEKTGSDIAAALKSAKDVAGALRKALGAARVGNLRDLPRTLQLAEQNLEALKSKLDTAKDGWRFDEATYLSDGSFVAELLAAARRIRLSIHEQDDRLYCYPSLIRVSPSERLVVIDKTKDKRLRPSVLAQLLKEHQEKPVRFNSQAFLDSLWSAYEVVLGTRDKEATGKAALIPLRRIYELLTLLPGQSKEYSRHEFARDLYLLDQSGVTTTRKGHVLALHPARGNEKGRVFSIVTKTGHAKEYYGISFS